jgi:hypothetical protein
MKKVLILSTLVLAIAFSSCKKDDKGFQFDPAVMHYDGVNDTSPFLPVGKVELAAQFKADAMEFYAGKKIDAIQFFIFDTVAVSSIVIYGKGDGSNPGAVLYEQDISNGLKPNDWNVIPLDTLFDLPSDEIWITLKIPDGKNYQVLGCDAGPAISGADWMYEQSDGEWKTFLERSTNTSINWNIRASMTE